LLSSDTNNDNYGMVKLARSSSLNSYILFSSNVSFNWVWDGIPNDFLYPYCDNNKFILSDC